ncbi:hypothetical protein DL96DRAFT_1558067 [Flagelloscypha sp. PMI_526]|nr:hypothetical protein DL96DRAFT_1558067 [Flagelloscypha sp. PMI_526]
MTANQAWAFWSWCAGEIVPALCLVSGSLSMYQAERPVKDTVHEKWRWGYLRCLLPRLNNVLMCPPSTVKFKLILVPIRSLPLIPVFGFKTRNEVLDTSLRLVDIMLSPLVALAQDYPLEDLLRDPY